MEKANRPLLVVDDEPDNLDMLARRLRRSGFAVETASNGRQALEKIQQSDYDMVLLDSMMPVMSGLDLLRLLRATHGPDELPVIMVTALHDSEKVVEALNLGANDYITKPLDFPVALARIESQLGRRRSEEALRESEQRYALAARGSNDGLWDWDLKTGRVYFSERWKKMLGFEEEEIGTRPEEWMDRVHEDDRESLRMALEQYLSNGEGREFVHDHRMKGKMGQVHWMQCRGLSMRSAAGDAVRMAGWMTDMTQSRAYDPLTGLPNRVMLLHRLGHCLKEQAQKTTPQFALMFIDLDRFKVINDSLGHQAGDALLSAVAQRLQAVVRQKDRDGNRRDIVVRMGGDEFAVLLEGAGAAQEASAIASRIVEQVQKPMMLEGAEVATSASVGIAIGSAHYENPSEILRDADTAMYQAKYRGAGCCEVFDDQMRAGVITRMEMEQDLRRALDRKEFRIYYQPKINLKSGDVVGFEALLRWVHPQRGMICPAKFIPIAEDVGLIIAIGEYVMRESCRLVKIWQRRFPVAPPLEMSVNVSVRQLQRPGFTEMVAAVLRETRVPPASLALEITESVLLLDCEQIANLLRELKQLGVRLKIDDFGTGYSSLSYLRDLPFDCIKIDQSLYRPGQLRPAVAGDRAHRHRSGSFSWHGLSRRRVGKLGTGVQAHRAGLRLRARLLLCTPHAH
jgi:diguanylate cyclase (GGDEF)-like protein/PAS domain S-box-containing protein